MHVNMCVGLIILSVGNLDISCYDALCISFCADYLGHTSLDW